MGAAQAVIVALQLAMVLGVVYLLGMSVYFLMNREDPSKAPSEKWPAWFRELVHVYPDSYSVSASSNVIPNKTPLSVFTAESPGDCVNNRKKGCKVDTDCEGFVWNATSNVCTILSDVNNLITDPLVTSNTLYVIEGAEPARYYKTYTGKDVTTPTGTPPTVASRIPPYIAADYFACSSNCSSNTTCLGFIFNPTTKNCLQHTAITNTALTPATGLNSYIFTSALTLMSSDLETF